MTFYDGKIENTANQLVDEMLEGLQAANPGVIKVHDDCQKLLVGSTSQTSRCVSVISGGRIGNEPYPCGFVGKGMLSAALYGQNFNLPTADEISQSIEIIAGDTMGTEILLIAPKNRENLEIFSSGAEKATSNKFKVLSVFVGKELEQQNSDPSLPPVADILSTILIFKIAGAMAMEGKPLETIVSTLENIISLMATFEINTTTISLRGPEFELEEKSERDYKDDDIHHLGDKLQDVKQECSLNDGLMKKLQEICQAVSIEKGNEVAVLVNIMYSTLQMVQWIFITRIKKELGKNGINVVRFYSGNVVSCDVKSRLQVCIVKLGRNAEEKEQWLSWLDAPTTAPAWPGGRESITIEMSSLPFENLIIKKNLKLRNENYSMKHKSTFNNHEAKLTRSCIVRANLAVIDAEEKLNYLEGNDERIKCGTTMKNMAEAILENLDNMPMGCPADLLHCIANICESQIPNDLGLVYAIFFTAAIPPLICVEEKVNKLHWVEAWGRAFRSGIKAINRYYRPNQEKKTLIDLLKHVCIKFESSPKRDVSEVILALNSCLPQTNEYKTVNRSKKRDNNEEGLENIGYGAEACGAEVCLKAIIKEISLHLSNSM